MGLQQSKDELLGQKAADGDIQAIKSLVSEGAGLEWIDKDGKTPLISACMYPEGYLTAKSLIELGAIVNAYRPGLHGGTPLHHAAKRGLEHTVRLLLSHGASPLSRNDGCQTPLDVARSKGFTNVVRAIESHICLYSGWMKELYGPGFLGALAPQLLSKKIWVVIVPCGRPGPAKPLTLELAIYSSSQDAQPRLIIALRNADIEEPKFHPSDPMLTIFDKSSKTRYRLASPSDGDRQQVLSLYNACKGIHQVVTTSPAQTATLSQTAAELAMGTSSSVQSHPNNHTTSEANNLNGWVDTTADATHNGWGSSEGSVVPAASSSGWMDEPRTDTITEGNNNANGWADISNATSRAKLGSSHGSPSSSGWTKKPNKDTGSGWVVPQPVPTENATIEVHAAVPSAPPLPVDDLDEGSIHYPSVDFSPADLSYPRVEQGGYGTNGGSPKESSSSSLCVICWEAPVEGACVPCGHMAGCMSCLHEIKVTNGDCPVCRAKIKEVIRLYAV